MKQDELLVLWKLSGIGLLIGIILLMIMGLWQAPTVLLSLVFVITICLFILFGDLTLRILSVG